MILKNKIILFLVVILSSLYLMTPLMASASIKEDVCAGVGISSGSGCVDPAGSPTVDNVIERGLNIFTAIVGIIAVVMIIIGGVKYMTSQGDSGKTAEAKNTVMYAGIGLVIVALSQIIVRFVLRRFTT